MIPNVFPGEKRDLRWGYVRFLPVLNNPPNLATARRRAASFATEPGLGDNNRVNSGLYPAFQPDTANRGVPFLPPAMV
jgi:hypothetical protein